MGMITLFQWISMSSMYIIGCFLLGSDSAIINGVHLSLLSEFPKTKDHLIRNLIIANSVGAILGTITYILLGMLKKTPYILGDVFILVGSYVAYHAQHPNLFYVSRFLIAFGAGVMTVSGPVLLGEAYTVRRTSSILASGGVSFNVAQAVGIIMTGLIPLVSLRFCLSFVAFPAILHLLVVMITPGVAFVTRPCWRAVFNVNLVAAILVQLSQISVGYKLILNMAPTVLTSQKWVSGINTISSIFSVLTFRVFKRKTIFFLSVTVTAIDLFFFSNAKKESTASMILLLLLLFIFNSSLATLPTIYTVEVLVKGNIGLGCGLVGLVNSGVCFAVAYTEDVLIPSVGEGPFLVAYGVISLLLMSVSLIIMPEPLEENEPEVKEEQMATKESGHN